MKKITALPIYGSVLILFAFSLAAGLFPVQPLNADTEIDRKIILAMEKGKEEMKENGELGDPTVEETEDGLTDLPLAEPAAVHPEIEISLEEIVTDRPAEPEEAEPAASPSPEPAEISLKEQLEKRGSLKFVDEDIRVVLRSLAKAYGFNVTLAPEVQGKVTVDFNNVKIINALDTILVDQGLGYRISGSILRVTTLEKIQEENAADAAREATSAQRAIEEAKKRVAEEAAEPVVVKVFELQHIDANDAQEAVKPLLSSRGKVMILKTHQFHGFKWSLADKMAAAAVAKEGEEFVRSKTLIVQDITSVLTRVDSVIQKIDKEPYQILIDAKIIEVPVNREFRLGINWTEALDQWKVGVKDMQAILGRSYGQEDSFRDTDSHDWGSKYELKSTWVEGEDRTSYDRREGKDGDTSGRMSYAGSGWPASGGSTISIPGLLDYTIPSNEAGGPFQQNVAWRAAVENDIQTTGWADDFYTRIEDSDTKSTFDDYLYGISDTLTKLTVSNQSYSAVLSAVDFSLMLSAMKTDSNIVLLSNPRIIVHENYSAKIFIGEEFPIVETEVSEFGVGGTSIEEWKQIGILLAVIPQVRTLKSGKLGINMIIHPEVSAQDGYAPIWSEIAGGFINSPYPIINTRGADSNVTVSDGDTIVIGGLIDSHTVDEEEKIPLLGDIPILGYLFKEEHTKLEKTNLLIFITAKIVGEDIELSPYEKIMLEKLPADALEDIRYVEDDQLRPYLYKSAKEPEPPEPEEGEGKEGKDGEREDNKGNFGGRIMTKAMKRSRMR